MLLVLPGCVHLRPQPPLHLKVGPPPASNLPGQVTGHGITIHWQENVPEKGVQRVMDLNGQTGSLAGDTDTDLLSGHLKTVNGMLYRDNRPKARFTAQTVQADGKTKTLIAQGHVVIHSIDPPGVTVTADRVIWHAERHRIEAEGDVGVTDQPPGADRPTAGMYHASHATIDTELKRITIP